MEVLGIGKERRKGGRGKRKKEKERKIDESRRVWKSVDRWKGGFGGGPTALVAVERTNFVLIEKSQAPNPIYKPANMAGVGRSLVSPRLTAPSANPDTQRRRDLSQPCTTYPG